MMSVQTGSEGHIVRPWAQRVACQRMRTTPAIIPRPSMVTDCSPPTVQRICRWSWPTVQWHQTVYRTKNSLSEKWPSRSPTPRREFSRLGDNLNALLGERNVNIKSNGLIDTVQRTSVKECIFLTSIFICTPRTNVFKGVLQVKKIESR